MSTATMPFQTASSPPGHRPAPAASTGRPGVSTTPEGASTAPARQSIRESLSGAKMAAAVVISLASLVLAAIGLYLSFEHVAVFAHEELGFKSLFDGRLFIAGVDTGILVLIGLDLFLAWLRRPVGWIRYFVWLLTGATVMLNASSQIPDGVWEPIDYVAVGAHALVPFLFIAVVEIGRKAIDRIVRHAADEESGGIPLSRWLLAFGETFGIWRKSKLWGVSYTAAVALERDLTVYRVMLERKHGSTRKAPSDARLPLTMAKYGLSVDQALMLPQEAAEREQLRREAEEERRVREAERSEQRKAALEEARLRAAGAVQAARYEVEGETGQAQARARATLEAARQAAQAEADRASAEDRKRAAEAAQAAAEAERRAAEDRRRAAEEARRTEAAKASTAKAQQESITAQRRAAEDRQRLAEVERLAVEAEDAARLSPRERSVRKLARTILTEADGDPEGVPLETVSDLFHVSAGTASAYRREAAELLASGYRPDGL